MKNCFAIRVTITRTHISFSSVRVYRVCVCGRNNERQRRKYVVFSVYILGFSVLLFLFARSTMIMIKCSECMNGISLLFGLNDQIMYTFSRSCSASCFLFRLFFFSTRSAVTHFYDRNHLVAYNIFINHRHMPDPYAICSIFHVNKRFVGINAMFHFPYDARRTGIYFFFLIRHAFAFFHLNDILIAIGKISINGKSLKTILHSAKMHALIVLLSTIAAIGHRTSTEKRQHPPFKGRINDELWLKKCQPKNIRT